MADTRQGLNCTLSYTDSSGRLQSYRLRVDTISWGVAMVAEESSARSRRAYYPHQVAPSQFSIGPILKGSRERMSFSNWMQTYTDNVMDPGNAGALSAMRVLIPPRGFDRYGIPLAGIEWGDQIGRVVWNPTVVFETTREPQDVGTPEVSYVDMSSKDPTTKFFWPTGMQLAGDTVPSGGYTTVIQPVVGTGSDPGQDGPPPVTSPGPNEGTPPSQRYGF